LLEKRPQEIVRYSLLAAMFDCLYVAELAKLSGTTVDIRHEDIFPGLLQQCLAGEDFDSVSQFRLAKAIGEYREKLSATLRGSDVLGGGEHWAGPLEAAALALSVHHATLDPRSVFPYSCRLTQVFGALMKLLTENKDREGDCMNALCWLLAFRF
jgi:hypothetical protein